MPETVQENETIPTSIGRFGLKLPEFEWHHYRDESIQVLDYFKQLLENNGLNCPTKAKFNGYRSVLRAFFHELVVPPSQDKSIVVIRAGFDPRPEKEVEQELMANKARGEWGRHNPATQAEERYGLYTTPPELGPMLPLVEVKYIHEVGGSGHSGPYQPAASVSWKGSWVEKDAPSMSDHGLSVDEYGTAISDFRQQRYLQVITDSIELLS